MTLLGVYFNYGKVSLQMSHVILCSPVKEMQAQPCIPYALLYLDAYLTSNGHTVDIFDFQLGRRAQRLSCGLWKQSRMSLVYRYISVRAPKPRKRRRRNAAGFRRIPISL